MMKSILIALFLIPSLLFAQADLSAKLKAKDAQGRGLSKRNFSDADSLLNRQNAANLITVGNNATQALNNTTTNANAITGLQNNKLDATSAEPGILKFNTYAQAVSGVAGRTKPCRVLVLHDEQNNSGNFGKYDYDGAGNLIEDVLE